SVDATRTSSGGWSSFERPCDGIIGAGDRVRKPASCRRMPGDRERAALRLLTRAVFDGIRYIVRALLVLASVLLSACDESSKDAHHDAGGMTSANDSGNVAGDGGSGGASGQSAGAGRGGTTRGGSSNAAGGSNTGPSDAMAGDSGGSASLGGARNCDGSACN